MRSSSACRTRTSCRGHRWLGLRRCARAPRSRRSRARPRQRPRHARRGARRPRRCVRRRQLDPTMLVVHARPDPRDVLTRGLDDVLDRLEDPRANRSVGNGEHALAGDERRKWIGTRRERRKLVARSGTRPRRAGLKRQDERVEVGMADRLDPVEIVDLPLVPVRPRHERGDRRVAARPPGQSRRDRRQRSTAGQHRDEPERPALRGRRTGRRGAVPLAARWRSPSRRPRSRRRRVVSRAVIVTPRADRRRRAASGSAARARALRARRGRRVRAPWQPR